MIKSFERLFMVDQAGDTTLEVVKRLSMLVVKRQGRIQKELVEAFSFVPLNREVAAHGYDSAKSQTAKTKKNDLRKYGIDNDFEKTLERDAKMAEAEVSLEHMSRTAVATISQVFIAYFRILKTFQTPDLLPYVLEGLAKFAHLINLEMILDLMELLKKLIDPRSSFVMDTQSLLHCVYTCFRVLVGKGAQLTIDIKDFYNHLYKRMWELAYPENHKHLHLLTNTLPLMFRRNKKGISKERIASYAKRVSSLALMVPADAAIGLMHCVAGFVDVMPLCTRLLDSDFATSGVYDPEAEDPDHANTFATTLWEIPLLARSYHRYLGEYSNLLGNEDISLKLKRLSPNELREAHAAEMSDLSSYFLEIPPEFVDLAKNKKKKKLSKAQLHKRTSRKRRLFRMQEQLPTKFVQDLYSESGQSSTITRDLFTRPATTTTAAAATATAAAPAVDANKKKKRRKQKK
jgi:nucleolar complex protein 3